MEYWESQERAMIEEYVREKVEAETVAEVMMRNKDEGIERARAEEEAKARDKDGMIKQVWREESLGAKTRRFKPETKSAGSEAQARSN